MHIFMQFGLLILFVFAALAFGAVHVWAYSIVYSAVLVLAALVLAGIGLDYLGVVSKRKRSAAGMSCLARMGTPWFFFTIAFLLFIALQLVPLPISFVKAISSYTGQLYSQAYSFLAAAIPNSAGSGHAFLTVDRDKTVKSLLAAASYVAFVFLMLWSLRRSKELDRYALILIIFSTGLCLFGFLRVLTHSTSIWGWEGHSIGAERVSATLINPDHFGAYLVMAVFLTFGYLLSYLRSQPTYMGGTALRRTLNMLSAENSPAPKIFLLLFIIALMVVALLYTLLEALCLVFQFPCAFVFCC